MGRGSRITELGSRLHGAELQTHSPMIQFCIFLQSHTKLKRTEHTYLVLYYLIVIGLNQTLFLNL